VFVTSFTGQHSRHYCCGPCKGWVGVGQKPSASKEGDRAQEPNKIGCRFVHVVRLLLNRPKAGWFWSKVLIAFCGVIVLAGVAFPSLYALVHHCDRAEQVDALTGEFLASWAERHGVASLKTKAASVFKEWRWRMWHFFRLRVLEFFIIRNKCRMILCKARILCLKRGYLTCDESNLRTDRVLCRACVHHPIEVVEVLLESLHIVSRDLRKQQNVKHQVNP